MYNMGRTSGMYGGNEKCMLGFSRKTSTKEDLGRDRRIWLGECELD
jgi:hypothetical protein